MIKVTIKHKFIKGWDITKSSLGVIRISKRLLVVPFLGFLINAVLLVLVMKYGFRMEITGSLYDFGIEPHSGFGGAVISAIVFYFLATLIDVFLTGVISHNVLKRFEGEAVSLRDSFRAAWDKRGPLLAFGLTSSIVGYLLSMIAERLPFAGKLATWLADASWIAASYFAVPVIMTDKADKTSPKQAVKRSTEALKRLWQEGVTTQFSLGLILLVTIVVSYVAYVVVLNIIDLTIGMSLFAKMVSFAIGFLGLIGVFLTFGLLNTIARCALFHYLRKGKDPENYDLSIVRAGMNVKKAKKLFT